MMSLMPNQKGIVHLFVIFIIFLGIAAGVFFINNPTFFRPKASQDTAQEVGVFVVSYLPPDSSGQRIDPQVAGTNETIANMRSKISDLNNQAIQSLTNATKYHGYKDASAPAALNYSIKDSKEVLAALPNGLPLGCNGSDCRYRPDYRTILNNYNICDLVDNQNVKQVWFWGYHYGSIEPVESNMSMGTDSRPYWTNANYGDISNSERTDDLPICKKTYVLYNYNFTRGLGEMLEDHGHHLESVMNFVDQDLFWNKWVNPHGLVGNFVNNCGWTHSPPNVTDANQYLWHSETTVKSACEDWKPDGTGQLKDVSCHTWYGAQCKDNGGVEFKVWWMQNMPGMNNGLTYNGKKLRSWWEFYGDLDKALLKGKTAYTDERIFTYEDIIKDGFNRANSTTSLGNAETGQAWQNAKGVWGIQNNRAYSVSGCPAPGYGVIDSGLSDGVLEVSLPVNGQDVRIPFRFLDLTNYLILENQGATYALKQFKDGGFSTLATSSGAAPQNNDRIRIQMIGPDITVSVNGVVAITKSVTGFSGTKYGIGTHCNANISFEDFLFQKINISLPSPSSTPSSSVANGTASFILDAPTNVLPNANFTVKVNAKSPSKEANTFWAKLNFDSSKLEVTEILMNSSVGSFVTQVDDIFFDNSTGEISLLGGLIDPGLKTVLSQGDVMAEIKFKAKGLGLAEIKLLSSSQIISNDDNTNIIGGGFPTLSVNIGVIPSPSPSAVPSVAPSVSPSVAPSPSASPIASPSVVPSPSSSSNPSVAPSVAPSPSPSSTPTPTPAPACIFSSAEWVSNANPVKAGTAVSLKVTGTGGCQGRQVAFVIKEDDGVLTNNVTNNPVNATFSAGNLATTSWIAEFQQDGIGGINNPPEYYFTANLVDNSSASISSSTATELKVNNLREGEFLNGDGNRDGKVDALDLSVLRKWWGKTGFPQEIDINDDGVINTPDLSALRKILEINGIIKTPQAL